MLLSISRLVRASGGRRLGFDLQSLANVPANCTLNVPILLPSCVYDFLIYVHVLPARVSVEGIRSSGTESQL